jgi:hypothetical protein
LPIGLFLFLGRAYHAISNPLQSTEATLIIKEPTIFRPPILHQRAHHHAIGNPKCRWKTYYSLRIDNLSYEQVKTLHEQVKTLLGGSRNPSADGNPTTTATTRNYTSNNSELDSVKKNLRPLLFNNKHVKFSKVEDFQLDFNSFPPTEVSDGAVHARTPVATRKAESKASLRIIQAITKSGNNPAERALDLHLALINPATREISKSAGFQNSNIKELEHLKDQVKSSLALSMKLRRSMVMSTVTKT